MSHKNAKKLGFFSALAMLVGSVVGIGIFLKNHAILRTNDFSGTGTLVSWIIGGLLSLFAAISFSEIGSTKTDRVHGLAGWARIYGGEKFGRFVQFTYSFFYFGILSTAISIFSAETIVNIFTTSHVIDHHFHLYVYILIAIGVFTFFMVLNTISVKATGVVATTTTILKFIPLIIVAFAGIIFANTNNIPPSVHKHGQFGQNAFNIHTTSMKGIMAALPAVLFAFDAFLGVGSMTNKLKGGAKRVPAVVIIGMVSILVLYLLIAISSILHASGMVSGSVVGPEFLGIFGQIFSAKVAKGMGIFVNVFICISTMGVVNALSALTIANSEQIIDTEEVIGAKKLKSKFGSRASTVYGAMVAGFWFIVLGTVSIVTNTDSYVDGVSNFPTLFFFVIYATVIVMYFLKRDRADTVKLNKYLFKISAVIAVLGSIFVVGYQLFYGFTTLAVTDGNDTTHWGLFIGDGDNLTGHGHMVPMKQVLIVLPVSLALFIIPGIINSVVLGRTKPNGITSIKIKDEDIKATV